MELERKVGEIGKIQEEVKRVAVDAKAKDALVKQLVSQYQQQYYWWHLTLYWKM